MATTKWHNHPFAGARKMKPTQKHRMAIWECMLGTVYARNAEHDVKYFDYDWDAAREWAGVDAEGTDPRVWSNPYRCSVNGQHVKKGQKVLYIIPQA